MTECRKCKNEIPKNITIEGKKHNLQNRKFCLDCSPFGGHNTKSQLTLNGDKICPKCKETLSKDKFYTRRGNKLTSYCKICLNQTSAERSRKLKKQAIEYKGGKCERCGYSRYDGALEFHHTDPSQKDCLISGTRKAWEKVKVELDKCVMLCSCCHREEHGIINGVFKYAEQDSNLRLQD